MSEIITVKARTHLVYDPNESFEPFTIDDEGNVIKRYDPDIYPNQKAFLRAHPTELFTSLPKELDIQIERKLSDEEILAKAQAERQANIDRAERRKKSDEDRRKFLEKHRDAIIEDRAIMERGMISLDPTIYRTVEERLKFFLDNDRYFTNNDITESRDHILDKNEYIYPIFRNDVKLGEYNPLKLAVDTVYNPRTDTDQSLNKYGVRLAARIVNDRVNIYGDKDDWYIYAWYVTSSDKFGVMKLPPTEITEKEFNANRSLSDIYLSNAGDKLNDLFDSLGSGFESFKTLLYVLLFFGGLAIVAYISTIIYFAFF